MSREDSASTPPTAAPADGGAPSTESGTLARPSAQLLLTAGAVLVFAVHAASYLYFFVDDEAIPLVYARNLLRGRGLVYLPAEGRVEGYSDFLHVLWSTLLLALSRAMSLPQLAPLAIGKAVSFALGIGIVLLTARALHDLRCTMPGRVGGLLFLALAGPLAVWSCSSLETVPFAFVTTALAAALLIEPIRPRLACVLAIITVLYRIDGFVFAGAVLASALAVNDASTRRVVVRQAVAPVIVATAAYHVARVLYFHTLLSAPFQAKVLYKLSSEKHLIVKRPLENYLHSFLDVYRLPIPAALALAAGVAVLAVRSRAGRSFVVAAGLLSIYASIVGDWMFGWRFLVPLLPLVAVLVALAISRLPRPAAWAGVALVVVGSGIGTRAFARDFVAAERKPLWWTVRRADTALWLAPYDDLIATARRIVKPGATIAYNQAGLLPFVLDLDNVDDLGICSRFEAGLPTTDVYFTEVGRYAPLTNAPVFGASDAYLLYRGVQTIVSRTDLLTNANGGHIPRALLGDFYRLSAVDRTGENAFYVRTNRDASRYQRDPTLFQENLAHTSRVGQVEIDGRPIRDDLIPARLPFLRFQSGRLLVPGRARITLPFARDDEDASALYIGALSANAAATIALELYDEANRMVAREEASAGRTPTTRLWNLPPGTRASRLEIDLRSSGPDATMTISDLRLNGQSAALREYVQRMLRFPASRAGTAAARHPSRTDAIASSPAAVR